LSQVKPKASGMLVCDSVITEEASKKKTLIGVFEHIYASEFPFVHGSMSLYTKLSDAAGDYQFRIELYDLERCKKIGAGTTPAGFN
jgi:hypothetical protein